MGGVLLDAYENLSTSVKISQVEKYKNTMSYQEIIILQSLLFGNFNFWTTSTITQLELIKCQTNSFFLNDAFYKILLLDERKRMLGKLRIK